MSDDTPITRAGAPAGTGRQEDPAHPHAPLSKSKVIAGGQCRLRVWLQCYRRDLATPFDPAMQAMLDAGTDVGLRAHELFPGGVLVDDWRFDAACARTAALMADPAVPAIFEAALAYDRVRIRVDVLERLGDGRWGLREVKSASRVKDTYLDDAAVQLHVLEGAGLQVPSVELIHVDGRYTRGVGRIDPRLLFARADVLAEARARQPRVAALVAALHHTLAGREAPAVEPSAHCWTPHGCEFWAHCTRAKPADWIYHLPAVRAARRETLQAAGVERITDIPDDVQLGTIAARVRQVLRSGTPFVSPTLSAALAGAGPPAFYLDFETMSPPLPRYPLTRPYERVPFQWSLHRLDASGQLTHRAFLADGPADPRRALAEELLAALGGTSEPILVYSPFEAGVLGALADTFPDLAPRLTAVRDRLVDLLPIVRAHLYHRDFGYSFSLKQVVPALVPGFGYDDLAEIADGSAASSAFPRFVDGTVEDDEAARLRRALLAYCERDTLALVELHRALLLLAEHRPSPTDVGSSAQTKVPVGIQVAYSMFGLPLEGLVEESRRLADGEIFVRPERIGLQAYTSLMSTTAERIAASLRFIQEKAAGTGALMSQDDPSPDHLRELRAKLNELLEAIKNLLDEQKRLQGIVPPAPFERLHASLTRVPSELIATLSPFAEILRSAMEGKLQEGRHAIDIAFSSPSLNRIPKELKAANRRLRRATSRCFIATAAYGDPQHPSVVELRAFRDRYLLPSRLGREVIDMYYLVSPAIAGWLSRRPAMRSFGRAALFLPVRLARRLNKIPIATRK